MPKLYEYFGLVILFYSNEHQPIHVHGKYKGLESKAEIIYENGKFKEIRITDVKGKRPLNIKELKKLKLVAEKYREDIVQKWLDFFVYNKKVEFEKITEKL